MANTLPRITLLLNIVYKLHFESESKPSSDLENPTSMLYKNPIPLGNNPTQKELSVQLERSKTLSVE